MTRLFPVTLIIAALCACTSAPTEDTVKPADATPQPTPAKAEPPVAAAANPAEYAGKYWVILQSDKDPLKAPPSVATLGAHPELKLEAKRLPSTKFKNLMPCYEVTVAGSWADKAAAIDMSKQLTALGVDNYVKNAGAFVKDTAKLDGYCSASTAAVAATGPGVGFVGVVGGATYLQIGVDAEVYERLLQTAGKNSPVGGDLGLWSQSVAAETVGAYTKGTKYDVVLANGTTAACQISGFESLTIGTPHFGYLDPEINPDGPTGPGCGEPAPFAQLDCDRKLDGPAIAFPVGKAPAPSVKGAAVSKEAAEAAEAAFSASDVWKNIVEGSGTKPQIDIATDQYTVGGKAFAVTVAHIVAEGECGGVDDAAYAVHELSADGKLGAQVVAPAVVSWGQVVGVLDVDADGKPEVITHDFTDSVRVDGATGDWSWEKAYCDCPC